MKSAHVIIAQTVRIIRIMQVTRELDAFTIKLVEPSVRTQPDYPRPVFLNSP